MRIEPVTLGKLAGACIYIHELCSSEGGGPPLEPFSMHLWIGFGGMEYLSTLTVVRAMNSERIGYLSIVYQLLNRLGRTRTIPVSLGVIPGWSSFKIRK